MATKLSSKLSQQSREAPFIFSGRVTAVGKNNLDGIPPASNHALVEVAEVLVAPTNLGDLRGRILTVALAATVKKGARQLWWATSWIFGKQIGVIETARADAARMLPIASDIVDERVRGLDARIVARLAGAALVVGGEVIDVEELGRDQIAEGTTWRRARLRVEVVVRGHADAEVSVQFPGAGSPRWAYAPRLVAGQRGVWILRQTTNEPRTAKVTAHGDYVALDPDDAHAWSSLQRIEALDRLAGLGNRNRRSTRTR